MSYQVLTYLDLRNAVRGKRFPSSMDGSINRALGTAYADVWTAANWPFKRVFRASLAVSSLNPTLPADFRSPIQVMDDLGGELLEYSYEEFNKIYSYGIQNNMKGRPEAWCHFNGVMYFAPVANTSFNFYLTYHRRLCSRDTNGNVQAGFLSADTDYPAWDEHHGVLIPRAMEILLLEMGDATATVQAGEFQRQLESMKDQYPTPPLSFGEYEGAYG